MTKTKTMQLVWVRDDLRVLDNPALYTAMQNGPTLAVFIQESSSSGLRPLGGAARWWLHHALEDLEASLAELGVPLLYRSGESESILGTLCRDLPISHVHWNRRYSPAGMRVDASLKKRMAESGVHVRSHAASLLHEPWELLTQDKSGYKVFTAFFNRLLATEIRSPLPAPAGQESLVIPPSFSENPASWGLLPTRPNWATGLSRQWEPGEGSALERLGTVLESIVADYPETRDRPDLDGSTALSPALRWGHLSAAMMWSELNVTAAAQPDKALGAHALKRQLAWRDFCWHLMYHHPQLSTRNLRGEFDDYAWAAEGDSPEVDSQINAWRQGATGYAMVDAGMKQLWETGWMHNRVRMITASFLVKNLGIHWRIGEQWFWDTLVDADIASNAANWQWVAGSGADASPFFRIFNPELQANKFDPQGSYRGRFAPFAVDPVVDLKQSRMRALDAYRDMKELQT